MVDTRDLKSLAHCGRVGSSPTRGTTSGSSSVGRAQPCQGWGREFESRFPLKTRLKVPYASSLVFCPGGGMVDARVSGARAARRAGSIPVLGTIEKRV